MNTAKNVIKNSTWLFASNIIMKIIASFVVIFLARKLGSEGFGQYSFVVAFVGFFGIIASFGFNSLMIRDIAKDKSLANKYFNNIMTLKIFFAIAALLSIFILSFFIGKSPTIILAIYILGIELVVGGFADTMRSIFQAYERMEFDAITNIIEKVLWAALLLLVIFNNLSLVNIALAILVSTTFGLIITYFFLRKYITKFAFEIDKVFWRKIIIDALPFALTGLFSLINFKIDQVLLSFMTTDIIVGWYSAAYKIIDILALIPSILLTALYPVFSRFYKENKYLLKKSFDFSLRYVIILCIPVVIGVFLIADKIILLIYGQSYSNSIDILKILIFISLISFINTPLFVTLNAIGKQKITMINTAITALVNIAMNLILIPIMSVKGAALATIVAEITFLILSSYQLHKFGLDLNLWKKSFKPVIAGVIMGIFMMLVLDWSIWVIIPCAALIYCGSLLLLREVKTEDMDLIKKVLKR
jgi:O-antigen/teichoic acid export membrane protein